MNRKTICIFSYILILTMILTGCGGGKSDDVGETGAKDSLNLGIFAEPTTLYVHEAGDEASRMLVYQIYDYLIRELPDSTLGPGVAESWDYSEDGTEITFHLRDDVKFHNGDIMTAEDVAFSINKALESDFTSRVTTTMDSAEVIDDNTVLLKLKHAFGPIEQCLATAQMGIINKKAYEADPEGYGRNPIGTGPYKFVEWNSGEDVILEAFEDYYKGEAPIKNVTFKILPDANTRVVALEKGEVDHIKAPMEEKENIESNPNFTLYTNESTTVTDIRFNNRHEIYSNKKVRQAIAHAVDKEAMILGAQNGYGVPLETPMTKGSIGWPEDFKNREHDVEKAKQLLAEAGYPDGFKTTIVTSDTEGYRDRAEILQAQLSEIGIEAEIESLEWGAFLDKVLTQRDYEITTMSTTVPYLDADHIYELYHSEMITKGRNYVFAELPELDELLDKARRSGDLEEREELYREICELWKEETITIPLYVAEGGIAANKDLKGINPDTLISEYNVSYFHWDN